MKKKAKEIAATFTLFIESEHFQRIVETIIDVQNAQGLKALNKFMLEGDNLDDYSKNNPRWYLEFLPENYRIISNYSDKTPLSEGVVIAFPYIKENIRTIKEKLTSEFEIKCKKI